MKAITLIYSIFLIMGFGLDSGHIESGVYGFNNMEVKETSSGEKRQFMDGETDHCVNFEIHTTTLNPGIKSHDPHMHGPEEIVIMMDGTTEMEIGSEKFEGKPGDIYFLGNDKPHAIHNTSSQPTMYLAFQWQ